MALPYLDQGPLFGLLIIFALLIAAHLGFSPRLASRDSPLRVRWAALKKIKKRRFFFLVLHVHAKWKKEKVVFLKDLASSLTNAVKEKKEFLIDADTRSLALEVYEHIASADRKSLFIFQERLGTFFVEFSQTPACSIATENIAAAEHHPHKMREIYESLEMLNRCLEHTVLYLYNFKNMACADTNKYSYDRRG